MQSFPLFDEGLSVEQVAERLGRAVSTTYGYLEAYIRHRRVTDATRWIPRGELEEIEAAVQPAGSERLKPIHEALGGRIGYERIRIAVACLANQTTDVEMAAPASRRSRHRRLRSFATERTADAIRTFSRPVR